MTNKPMNRYHATVRPGGHAVERLARHAGGAGWYLSTGVLVLEGVDLELAEYVAGWLNAHTSNTSAAEGLAPLEALEEIKVKRARDSVVYELADGEVDETGVWIDAACWAEVGLERSEVMS